MSETKPHFLPDQGKRSASIKIDNVHLVKEVHGDNFEKSLCGVVPTGKSLGWMETSLKVNCDKCLQL